MTAHQPAPATALRPPSGGLALRTIAMCAMLAAALITATAKATPANAATGCGRNRVTVLVDFSHFHGKIKIGCDRHRPANGLVALRRAGFTYTFVRGQPGFICTIDSRPRRCNGAPATAYWSYWHARPHGKWIYSTLGAGSYHPKLGWVEGWAFGKGKPPRIPPP